MIVAMEKGLCTGDHTPFLFPFPSPSTEVKAPLCRKAPLPASFTLFHSLCWGKLDQGNF